MTDRNFIFGSIYSRLARTSNYDARRRNVAQHLGNREEYVVPKYLEETNDLIALFRQKALQSGTKIYTERTDDREDLLSILHQILPTKALDLYIPHQLEISVPKNIHLKTGIPPQDASWGLSLASSGVAESGSVMVVSSNVSAVQANMSPENSIVLLREKDIYPTLEEAFAQAYKESPRALICVTGPSRTADIGQKLVMGAHGPKNLHIILMQ